MRNFNKSINSMALYMPKTLLDTMLDNAVKVQERNIQKPVVEVQPTHHFAKKLTVDFLLVHLKTHYKLTQMTICELNEILANRGWDFTTGEELEPYVPILKQYLFEWCSAEMTWFFYGNENIAFQDSPLAKFSTEVQ